MHTIQDWLSSVPPAVMYLLLALVVMVESMGVPLPGEIALVSAALLASQGYAEIGWVCFAASLGAIIGDSTGYLIGHRGGRPFLERLGRRFPKHLGPPHLARAERMLQRWGSAAIFFGRFIALLRVLAGPLAGALRMPYRKFLVANVAGGIVWATGTALIIFFVGKAAEAWLSRFSWVALAVAVAAGIVSTMILRHRAARAAEKENAAQASVDGAEAAVATAAAANPLANAATRADHAPTGNARANHAPTGKVPTGKVPTGKAPTGDARASNASASDATAGDATAGDAEAGDAEGGDATAGDAEGGDAEGGDAERSAPPERAARDADASG